MLLTSSIQIENRSNQNKLIRLAMRLSRYAGVTPGDRVPRAFPGHLRRTGVAPRRQFECFFQVSVFSLERR